MADDALTTAQDYYRAAVAAEERAREHEERTRAQEQRIVRSLRYMMIITAVCVVSALSAIGAFVTGLITG